MEAPVAWTENDSRMVNVAAFHPDPMTRGNAYFTIARRLCQVNSSSIPSGARDMLGGRRNASIDRMRVGITSAIREIKRLLGIDVAAPEPFRAYGDPGF